MEDVSYVGGDCMVQQRSYRHLKEVGLEGPQRSVGCK